MIPFFPQTLLRLNGLLYQLVLLSGAEIPVPVNPQDATLGRNALTRYGLEQTGHRRLSDLAMGIGMAADDGVLSAAQAPLRSGGLHDVSKDRDTFDPKVAKVAVDVLSQASDASNAAHLIGAKVLFASTADRLKKGKLAPKEFRERVNELLEVVAKELEEQIIFKLSPEYKEYWENEKLFGPEVAARFPAAAADIAEGGRCLALWRGTACVFHLMRVMEVGLKALAKPLHIPYAPSWESYLTQISNNINLPHKKKPRKWKQVEPFFRDVLGDLQAIKVAWRNPTMHIVKTYTVPEAHTIFGAVRTLTQRLAKELPEDGKKKS